VERQDGTDHVAFVSDIVVENVTMDIDHTYSPPRHHDFDSPLDSEFENQMSRFNCMKGRSVYMNMQLIAEYFQNKPPKTAAENRASKKKRRRISDEE
jgi:hypothetical protein